MANKKVPRLVAGGLAGPGSLYSEERMLAREGKPRNLAENAPSGDGFKKGKLPPSPTITMVDKMAQVKQTKRMRGSRSIRPPRVKV